MFLFLNSGFIKCQVKWIDGNIDEVPVNTGIVLTVGFVPGLKVDVIPLLRQRKVKF